MPSPPDSGIGLKAQRLAQSLAQGDAAGAKSALDRLGDSIKAAEGRVQTNRDLARAASRLQDSRRNLADAGRGRRDGSELGVGIGQAQALGRSHPSPASWGENGPPRLAARKLANLPAVGGIFEQPRMMAAGDDASDSTVRKFGPLREAMTALGREEAFRGRLHVLDAVPPE